MTARVDLVDALTRRSGRVLVRPGDVDGVHADAVERNLLQLRLRVVEPLAEQRESLPRRIRRWREHRRRRARALRRIGAAIARREAFVDARDRDREPAIARGQPHAEFGGLAAEVLAIDAERRRLVGIVRTLRTSCWSIQSDTVIGSEVLGRVPPSTTRTTYSPSTGNAMDGVKRVGEAEPGDVVLGWDRRRLADAASLRSQPRQRRVERRRPEEREARDPLGRGDVLLHQRGRERQHVADVVEAVAGVVLGKVVGRPDVHAEQVPDRVVVFGAIEAASRHTARIGRRLAGFAGLPAAARRYGGDRSIVGLPAVARCEGRERRLGQAHDRERQEP